MRYELGDSQFDFLMNADNLVSVYYGVGWRGADEVKYLWRVWGRTRDGQDIVLHTCESKEEAVAVFNRLSKALQAVKFRDRDKKKGGARDVQGVRKAASEKGKGGG